MRVSATVMSRLKSWAKGLKRDIGALYLASRRKEIGLLAKVISVLVVAYALSPVDLIPDFIPVLGYIDDLIILPLGIALAVHCIPDELMEKCRVEADRVFSRETHKSFGGALVIILIWCLLAYWGYGVFRHH